MFERDEKVRKDEKSGLAGALPSVLQRKGDVQEADQKDEDGAQ